MADLVPPTLPQRAAGLEVPRQRRLIPYRGARLRSRPGAGSPAPFSHNRRRRSSARLPTRNLGRTARSNVMLSGVKRLVVDAYQRQHLSDVARRVAEARLTYLGPAKLRNIEACLRRIERDAVPG